LPSGPLQRWQRWAKWRWAFELRSPALPFLMTSPMSDGQLPQQCPVSCLQGVEDKALLLERPRVSQHRLRMCQAMESAMSRWQTQGDPQLCWVPEKQQPVIPPVEQARAALVTFRCGL